MWAKLVGAIFWRGACLVTKKQLLRGISLRELLGRGLSVPAIIHGPYEVLHKWIMRIHDVV